MKKLALALCILGSTVALSACANNGTGYSDTAPPYADERTASGEQVYTPAPSAPAVKAERTFRDYQSK